MGSELEEGAVVEPEQRDDKEDEQRGLRELPDRPAARGMGVSWPAEGACTTGGKGWHLRRALIAELYSTEFGMRYGDGGCDADEVESLAAASSASFSSGGGVSIGGGFCLALAALFSADIPGAAAAGVALTASQANWPLARRQVPGAAAQLQTGFKVVRWSTSKSDCDKFVPVGIEILGKIFLKNIFKNILFLKLYTIPVF